MTSKPISARASQHGSVFAMLFLILGMAMLTPLRTLGNTTENQSTADGSGVSSLTGTSNWTPSTTVAPTNILATTYDYITATTLRTPQNQNSYTVNASSLTINSGGSLGFKGSNVVTVPNLILNGGKIANSATSGNPDMARLAGSINLTANSTLAPNNAASSSINILATITNSGSSSANLTVGNAGTAILSAQNTFLGNIIVANQSVSAVLKLGLNNAVPPTAIIQLNGGSSAGASIFDLNGFSTVVTGINPTSGTVAGYVTNSAVSTTSALTISNNISLAINNGIIADNPGAGGTVALAFTGNGTVTLNTASTYHGSTTISAGTLALGGSGSINNSSSIGIAAGATFDVSQISSYALGSATLSASGTGAAMGTTAATINGSSSVSLGAQPITLTFTPAAFSGDLDHPSLLISQGDLTLNNNSFTVNNASGTALGAGTYQLVTVSSGNINQNATPAYALTVMGSGLAANTSAAIQISGGSVNLVVTSNGNPPPTFSGLTASASVAYGTATLTLGGRVGHGSIYPASGETVTVTIDGNAQATTINDSTGDFSISYNLSGIPASASPYTITYSYGGDGSLGPAVNTSTALTLQRATAAFSGLTASQTISYGTAAITLGGKVSAGPVYPPAGETVTVSINGDPQNTTISDNTGDFSIGYNSANIPGNATPYAITYSYGGDVSFNGVTNSSATLSVQTNTITENQTSTDPGNFSSLIAAGNWTPATTIVPTNALATNYNFITALTLRTPPGTDDYTVYAGSFTLNAGGALGFKGSGVVTIPNLVLNGGQIANSSTGGNPDLGQLAGNINLTANSSLKLNGAATSMLNIKSVITNVAGISPTLTCSGGGTVIFSGQNSFGGNIVVAGAGAGVGTVLQLGTNNALPPGAGLTLNGGSGATGPAILDLNGYSTTITNLAFSSTAPNYGYVTNSAFGTTGTLTLGNSNTTQTLQFGTIADDPATGGKVALAKIGSGVLTVSIATTYSGNTTIAAGTLVLDPSGTIPNSAKIIVASNATFDVSQTYFDLGVGQTLAGGGTISGFVQADGTLAPAGTLTFNNDLTINGNLAFNVNTSQAQSNDVINVAGTLNNTSAGTLIVNNLGPALVAGDKFTLFNQLLPNGNNFTIVPPLGVVLANNLALDGTITVLSVTPVLPPHITNISLSGTNMIISGTNGLAGAPCNVLATTNLALPLAKWTVLPTNVLGGANFSITNPVDPSAPQFFFILRIP